MDSSPSSSHISSNVLRGHKSVLPKLAASIVAIFVLCLILGQGQFWEEDLLPYHPPESLLLLEDNAVTTTTTTTTSLVLSPPEPTCTLEEATRQANTTCDYWDNNDRYNLRLYFALIRYHLPQARTLLDIGTINHPNDGLISARWLELWRPQLHIGAKYVAETVVQPTFQAHGLARNLFCGEEKKRTTTSSSITTTTMICDDQQDSDDLARLINESPTGDYKDFCIHSFEPSVELFQMHEKSQQSSNLTMATPQVRNVWKWYNIALSNTNGMTKIPSPWSQGRKIKDSQGIKGKEMVETRVATLDTLTYDERLFDHKSGSQTNTNNVENGGPKILDIINVNGESVQVIAGASRLLLDQRIRILMWEPTTNPFPVEFPMFHTTVSNFQETIALLDERAGMTCYLPGKNNTMFKLSGCSHSLTMVKSCNILQQSNVLCVHRTLASTLHRVLESMALILDTARQTGANHTEIW